MSLELAIIDEQNTRRNTSSLRKRLIQYFRPPVQGKAAGGHFVLVLIMLLFMAWTQAAAAEVIVIVHPDNPLAELNREQLIDIYMGRYTHFPDGRTAIPLDQAPDSPIRAAYYQKLINKSVAQVNAFWARLLFSGRATPPRVLTGTQAVIDVVTHNRNAIGYIDNQDLNDNVKVVLRLP